MRWLPLLLLVVVGCDNGAIVTSWDCHGAGFMQGCKDGRIQQRYYQMCDRKENFKPVKGYRWTDDETVYPGDKPDYDIVFNDNDSCDWENAVSDNHKQMMGLMGMPSG